MYISLLFFVQLFFCFASYLYICIILWLILLLPVLGHQGEAELVQYTICHLDNPVKLLRCPTNCPLSSDILHLCGSVCDDGHRQDSYLWF